MFLKEYDNKRVLFRTHLQSFVCLPKRKFETAAELKKLQDTVSVALATLSKLGCQVSFWDPIVVFIMTEKLGSKTRGKWSDKLGDAREYASYKELDAFLSGRIHSLSDFAGVADTVVDNSPNKGRSFVNNVSVQNCVNCVGSHSLAKYEKFLSLSVFTINAVPLLEKSESASIVYGRVTSRRSVQVNCVVYIVGACITCYYILRKAKSVRE
ncbi:hypothetical protein HN011_005969 [Eciton burchellii]|nr:hypothetical protein HN011_005969 [Eciton burchellii]